MDGLSRLDKYWLKQENLQVHRRQNSSRVKTGLKRLNKQSLSIKKGATRVDSSSLFLRNSWISKTLKRLKMNPGNSSLNPLANYAGQSYEQIKR